MFSTSGLERLIAEKRLEIEKEKTALGLTAAHDTTKENDSAKAKKKVSITENGVSGHNAHRDKEEDKKSLDEVEDIPPIPPGLERYIRRYIGLPVMLKAGEYSPNNPLIRGERAPGDVLLGLGEYERRRNTLRKLRQQQYREYLDQQAKKKQEAKEQADRERREREEKERNWEEQKERERKQIEQDRLDAEEQRRASVCYVPTHNFNGVNQSLNRNNKVDSAVQVGISQPLSVAVQTDDAELYRLSPSPTKSQLTEAERELSPRTVVDPCDRPIQPAPWLRSHCDQRIQSDQRIQCEQRGERRRSYGDFDERSSTLVKKSNRDKLMSDLRHTHMPSIFDADAIQMRNMQAEKEAAERRQFYQQELKNQILEQQRIREERKSREKMLEQAEMRRLEEQLRMLRVAQEREVGKQHYITAAMKENASEFDKKRTSLQKEIDLEHQKLLRATTLPNSKRNTVTSHSDTVNPKPSNLPFYYPQRKEKLPYSTNIPDNSIFSPNYDVDSYLRRNLNPPKDVLRSQLHSVNSSYLDEEKSDKVIVQNVQALIHERPKERLEKRYEPSFKRKDIKDEIPVPVLIHSPKTDSLGEEKLSRSMKLVEDKWKVPVVQRNLLKNLPNEEGKNVSILTQLGSIRRQLQLEQLKLDNMYTDDV